MYDGGTVGMNEFFERVTKRNKEERTIPQKSYYDLIKKQNLVIFGSNQKKKYYIRKQSPTGVLKKRCSGYMQQIYRRTPTPKCDYNEVAKLRHGCSPVNFLHIFRTPLLRNTSG